MSVASDVCCQVQVSVSGSPTDYGVSECDHEDSIKRKPKSHWRLLYHGSDGERIYISYLN